MRKLSFTKYLSFAFVVMSLALITSCGKVEDSIAKVTVTDATTGAAIPNATVLLTPDNTILPPPNAFLFDSLVATTDAKGIATFNLNEYYKEGTAGLMVLDINVDFGGVRKDGLGIIKIEEETLSEESVQY